MRNRGDLKNIYNSNYRLNRLPVNLDDDKYRMRGRSRFFIRSNLNVNHMKIQRMCSLRGQFYKWIWIVTLKKIVGVGDGRIKP